MSTLVREDCDDFRPVYSKAVCRAISLKNDQRGVDGGRNTETAALRARGKTDNDRSLEESVWHVLNLYRW
jgi:hypothetical protein